MSSKVVDYSMSRIKSDQDQVRADSFINKNDLINSNPGAIASGSNSSGYGRASIASENGSDASGTGKQAKGRRRKANRACSHCQKAHLTCDDARPCERCVKKGLADTCTDGARKKAKYLLDEDELLELKREKERKAAAAGPSKVQTNGVKDEFEASPDRMATPSDWTTPKSTQAHVSPSQLVPFGNSTTLGSSSVSESAPVIPAIKNNILSNGDNSDLYGPISGFSPASSNGLQHVFGSETTSLEYSILSSMLNGIDPAWLSGTTDGVQGTDASLSSVMEANNSNTGPFSHMGIDGMPWQLGNDDASTSKNRVEPLHHMDPPIAGNETADKVNSFDALEVPSPEGAANASYLESQPQTGQNGVQSEVDISSIQRSQNDKRAAAAIAAATGQDKKPDAVWRERVKHIYSDQMKPFRYTEGYHFLIKYVTANLEKAEVLRIVRALAIFRPSLIALQMPLTEEDEIFVERSIQRTILEFEKLISFSGTPTVVWRRTCEIVVVGAEFSMLTQWSKDYLRGRYIYEFFDKPSILEYWEKFALHAFENTAQSIHMQVNLKTSTGNTVKCAACFSIKRDVFDLPALIVGNFLPILS